MGLTALVRFAALIALRRTAADWRLQAAAGFGMVLAVALMASGVIYSHALEETALRHTLRNVPDEELNLSLRVFHALERPAFDASSRYIEDRVHRPLRQYLQDSTLLIQTNTLYFTDLPKSISSYPERPRGNLQAITSLEDHARLVEGRFPRPASGEVEIAIDPLGASALNMSVGQRIYGFSAIGGDQESSLPMRVVGIIEPLEPSDQYWRIGVMDRSTNTERRYLTVPLYAERDALFDAAGAALPGLHTQFIWLFRIDREGLRASEVKALRAAVLGASSDLRTNLPNSSSDTGLDEVVRRYTTLLSLAQVPLFLVLFLAVGVLLYYLFLIAGLLGRSRAPEVALFLSRGASTVQVGLVILVEGMILAVLAIVLGPFLGLVLVVLTGRLFPAVPGEEGLGFVGLAPSTFLLGGVGALLALVVLTAATLGSARHGVVVFRSASARPPQTPFLHRYYIDLALLALIGVLWWQIKSQGAFLVRPLGGEGLELDVTLLLGPVLGLVAAGLLLLRLFPLVLRIVARLAEPSGSAWLVHSLRRIARDPVPAGALLVLLAVATAMGVLGANVIATLERSQREQALYQAGADLRIRHSLGARVTAGDSVARSLVSLPEVAAAADALRRETRATTANFGTDATLLAVDVESLPQVAWFRRDLIGPSIAEALKPLKQQETAIEGVPLPPNTTALGVWVQPGLISDQTFLMARLRDGTGSYFDVSLGELSGRGWTYLEAPIEPAQLTLRRGLPAPAAVAPPFTLHTLWVRSLRGIRTTGAVFLDHLQAVSPGGAVELASFQNVEGWHPLEDALTPGLSSLALSEAVARPGRRSAVFTWGGGGLGLRGIRVGPPETPLPTLVSRSFLDANQVRVGDEIAVSLGTLFVPMSVAGSTKFFPTLDPRKTPFVLADLGSLLNYMALHSINPAFSDMEVWVRSAGGDALTEPVRRTLEDAGGTILRTHEAAGMIAERTADPLLTAGWSGLLALSFLVVVLASVSGLILHTYIDARERQGEFAVLQTLGFSHHQVNGVVWFNLAVTVVCGLAVGTLGGQWLGSALLPLLEVAEEGTRITPPMVLQNNWSALGLTYLVLAVAALATVAALAWAVGRLEVQRLLRVTEA